MEHLEFETENIDYSFIEEKITHFYDLGYADSSNFLELEMGVHSNYCIIATKGVIEFSSLVGKKSDNNSYHVTIIPKSIKRNK